MEAAELYNAIMQASHEVNGIAAKWMDWEYYSERAADKDMYVRAAEILSEKIEGE